MSIDKLRSYLKARHIPFFADIFKDLLIAFIVSSLKVGFLFLFLLYLSLDIPPFSIVGSSTHIYLALSFAFLIGVFFCALTLPAFVFVRLADTQLREVREDFSDRQRNSLIIC